MAASRQRGELGQPAEQESKSAQKRHDPRKPIEADEESTTVDDGPHKPGEETEDRWEEMTHREGAGPRTPAKGLQRPPLIEEDSGEVLRETIDRAGTEDDDEDEPTVRADERHFATGTGEVGTSTMDELTVEDQARPLPPLSALPPLPLAKTPGKKSAPAEARPVSPTAGKLIVTAGNDSGREFELTGSRVVVGRGLDCDVVLTDIAVSRKHLEISLDDQKYTLRDMGSGNGTLINDRLEDGACQLQHNDRLELGNTVIRFEHSRSKADQAVFGFGNQVEVDEEASTIAGRGRVNPEPQPLSANLLKHARPAAAGSAAENNQTPSVLAEMVLPSSPPGAAISADAPHAPVVARGAATVGEGNAARGDPSMNAAGDLPFATPLPQVAESVALGPPPQYMGELLLPIRRNRILIGLISATLGLVIIAIVATVLRSGSSSTTAETAPGETKPAAADTSPALDKAPAKAAADVEPAPAKKLAPETWGTNEVLLAARTNGLLSRASKATAPADPKPVKVAPKRAPVQRTAKAKPKPKKRKSKAKSKAKPKRRATKRRTTRKPKRTATAKPKRSGSTSAVRNKAAGMYRAKKFNTAANTLRTAASAASSDNADSLRSLASRYEAIGTNLAKAKQTQSSNPTGSMANYRRALSLDKKVGDGVHGTYIRLQLGRVAPKAAASYMAQRRYEAAKKAADAAVNYGAGADPTVRRVRKALERKAGDFYKSASGMMKKKKTSAKKLLRRVLKMVPADSPWYGKAYKMLNARSTTRDDDE